MNENRGRMNIQSNRAITEYNKAQIISRLMPLPFPLQLEHKHSTDLEHVPCHPHRVPMFDPVAIHEQVYNAHKSTPTVSSSEYESEISTAENPFQDAWRTSKALLDYKLQEVIRKKAKFIQERVFLGMSDSSVLQYVGRLRSEIPTTNALNKQLTTIFETVQETIEQEFQQGTFDLFDNKKTIFSDHTQFLRIQSQSRVIENKLAEIQKEIEPIINHQTAILPSPNHNIFNAKFQLNAIQQMPKVSLSSNNINVIENDKVEIAQKLILRMKQQKQLKEISRKKRQQKDKEKVEKQQKYLQQQKQRIKKQKAETLTKKYNEGRIKKQVQQQKRLKQKEQFKKYLIEYKKKKPLFAKKQEEWFTQWEEEERIKVETGLKRAHKQSVTLEDLKKHQQRLKQYKRLREQRIKQPSQPFPQRQYYKSRFHSLTPAPKADPLTAHRLRQHRVREFGKRIRQQFAPTVDLMKKEELQRAILKEGQVKIVPMEEGKAKKEGDENLKFLHEKVKLYGKAAVVFQQPKSDRKIDYLSERRKMGGSIDLQTLARKDAAWTERKAEKHQLAAKRKEKIIAISNFDLERHMYEISRLNDQYLQAAQTRRVLFSQFICQAQDKTYISQKYSSISSKEQNKQRNNNFVNQQ